MQDDFRPRQPRDFRPEYRPDTGPSEPPVQFTPHEFQPPTKKGKGRTGHLRRVKDWFNHLSKKQKIIFFSILAGLIIASALIWWFALRPQPKAERKAEAAKEAKPEPPKTVASCLTGAQVPTAQQNEPVTGIMIENSTAARPQSGLYDAGMVFEAIAEGGITRFLALYQHTSPDYIGPVRSLRPYYLDFLTPFTNAIAHAGGSADALAQVQTSAYRNLEAFQNGSYFQRIGSRAAPHNLYTNRARLVELQNSKGANSTCSGFKHTTQEHPAATPSVRSIDVRISGPIYNVHYDYDPTTNSYLRSLAGAPHIDERANKQLQPKVVVVLAMSLTNAGKYSVYGTTGSGTAFVFQDGNVGPGTWEKSARGNPFILKDAAGNEIQLNPGQTWVSIVGAPSAVSYAP